MKQHQAQSKKIKVSNPFASPVPVRKGQFASPFIRDLSPFPITFLNRSFPSNSNLQMIQTPMVNSQYAVVDSMIQSIIDWQQPLMPIMPQQLNGNQQQQGSGSFQESSGSFEQSEDSFLSDKNVEPKTPNRRNHNPLNKQDQNQDQSNNNKLNGAMIKQKNKNTNGLTHTQQKGEKKVTCNCKKTKCLKLYCDCFRINQTCDGCNCTGCHNTTNYQQQRNNAILTLMERNQQGFKPKIQGDQHAKGCNCKKSGCLKKYCQCYQAGLKCCDLCKCQQCKNKQQNHDHEDDSNKDKQKVKKDNQQILKQLIASISPIKQSRSASKMTLKTTAKKEGRFQQYTNFL